jgi:energy-coupling factor transporter ATP-binding protein EcfA2
MSTESEQLTEASAMHQLAEWSSSAPLPIWQQDALRRLYESCPLSSDDEASVFSILKHSHAMIKEGETPDVATPLSPSNLPAVACSPTSVTLHSIRNLNHVNALSSDQTLSFKENGVTIIFGNNGSGKSGYTRLLKLACRARSAEDILHNVYDTRPRDNASATIRYRVNGVEQPAFEWRSGNESHKDLSTISVFDSKCAPIHVDERNEAAYIPHPLRLLKELSDLCRKFKLLLQAELNVLHSAIPVGMRRLKCSQDTSAGKYLHTLNADSSIDELNHLGSLNKEDMERIRVIQQTLSSDPIQLANQREAAGHRLQILIQRTRKIAELASDEKISEFQKLLTIANAASAAATIAANRAFNDQVVLGVGSDAWKRLWEAAREFSLHHAYISKSFPVTKDAHCVLCQQPLDEDAAKRLVDFESFVQDKTQESSALALRNVELLRATINGVLIDKEQASQDVFFLDKDLSRTDLAVALRHFYRTSSVRLGRLLSITSANQLPGLRSITSDPIIALQEALQKNQSQVTEIRELSDPTKRLALEKELKELTDRVFLQSILVDAKDEIERLQKIRRLNNAIGETDTNRITRKSTELSDSLVTDAWRDRFAAEVSKLDVHHLRIGLQRDGGSYGAAKFRVALIQDDAVKLGSVLSEGEYRCIALAAFFAELATSHHNSSLIFDDPVSSLDHEHRESVAKRLADEAVSGRQIIVFTHDVYFLDLLSRHTRKASVPIKFLTVNRIPYGNSCGAIDDDVPSTVAPSIDLANGIRRQVQQFEGLYTSGRLVQWNGHANSFSIQLRKCWERAVAEALSPVVERFSASIETKNIWKIAALEVSDCLDMRRAYKRCSELNHEKCADLNRNDPAPADYYGELDALEKWILEVRRKQNDAFDNRPSA